MIKVDNFLLEWFFKEEIEFLRKESEFKVKVVSGVGYSKNRSDFIQAIIRVDFKSGSNDPLKHIGYFLNFYGEKVTVYTIKAGSYLESKFEFKILMPVRIDLKGGQI